MSSSSGPVWDPLPHRRTVAALRVLAIASIIGPLLLLAAGGFLEWRRQHESADAETDRLLALVADSSMKLFEAQLLALEQTVLLVRNLDAALNASEFEIHARLSDMMRHLPFVRNIFVADRYGHALVDAYRYPAPSAFSVAGRDYFDYFRNGGTGRFIGRLGYRYSDGLPFVPFTVRRPAPVGSDGDGAFTGVVTASINPEFFETFFRQVLNTYPDYDDRSISLRRADGRLLARSATNRAAEPGYSVCIG